MTTLAVTGASGQLGRLIATQLLDAPGVVPADVVLLSRKPRRLQEYAERGATVRQLDFEEPSTLPDAFEGVDKLILVSIDQLGPRRIELQRNAVEAARTAGVGLIAYTSIPEPTSGNPAGVVPDHAATEDAIRATGVPWTFLRNNVYADLQPPTIEQAAKTGRWLSNTGSGAAAFVTRADCAAVAVGVLTGTGHEGQSYDVTGPEAWTARALAALAAERGGRAVEVVDLDDPGFAVGLEKAGLPREIAQLLTSFGTSTREGYLARVTDVVARVGGRPATSLRDLVG